MSLTDAIIDELFSVKYDDRKTGHNFDGKPVTPARESASRLAEAMLSLIGAKLALDQAKRKVPSYTAQWSDSDYYADEQETYNRACEAFENAILNSSC